MTTVLLFGSDRQLLESRAWLLKSEGHTVLTATNLNQLKTIAQEVDLVILCHTLSPEDCRQASVLRHLQWPLAKELKLFSWSSEDSHDPDAAVVPVIDGPARLLRTVGQLLRPDPLHPVALKHLGRAERALARVR